MRLFSIVLSTFLYAKSSYAYFDPGTGAFVVQAIIAFLAAIAFYLGYPIRFIKNIYQKIKYRLSKNKKD